jgi:hypothetical protein
MALWFWEEIYQLEMRLHYHRGRYYWRHDPYSTG